MAIGDEAVTMQIGEVAARTGMTVRSLHYYEQIGLLTPAGRSAAGYRVYGHEQIERLYRIAFLRSIGLPLEAVSNSLDSDRAALQELMGEHLAAVDADLVARNRLRARLVRLVESLESNESTTGGLLDVLEDMIMTRPVVDQRISIIVYDDIDAAFTHLVDVYALGPGEVTRDETGRAVHAAINAGDGEVWLHPETSEYGLASPKHLQGASAMVAIMVDDVDAHYRHAVEHGANIRYEPVDQPYGYREYGAIDPEGHLWSFMKALV